MGEGGCGMRMGEERKRGREHRGISTPNIPFSHTHLTKPGTINI